MKANLKIGCRAEYKFIRRKATTNKAGERIPGLIVEETPWMKNILTYTYFNQAFTEASLAVRGIAVGTGTTAAAIGQSGLITFLAATTTRMAYTPTFNSTSSPRSVTKEFRYRFAEGAAAGNIAEVGMFTSASSGTNSATAISSRARVVDGFGAPTTVTVLSDEFLDVIWRCTWFVPEDVTGTCNISIDGVPTSFNWTIRAIGLQAYASANWWDYECIGFCPIIGEAPNSARFMSVCTTESSLRAYDDVTWHESNTQMVTEVIGDTYTANSMNRTFRFKFGLTQANISIRSFIFRNTSNFGYAISMGTFQILLNNSITKVNTKTMTFIINMAMANVP